MNIRSEKHRASCFLNEWKRLETSYAGPDVIVTRPALRSLIIGVVIIGVGVITPGKVSG